MTPDTDALKRAFREGRRTEAIAQCEALVREHPAERELARLCANMHALARNFGRALELLLELRNPAAENPDVLFNIAMCERELGNFGSAARYFGIFTEKFPDAADGWASLAECRFRQNQFEEAVRLADRALQLAPSLAPAWTVRGNAQKALGLFDQAIASYGEATRIAPIGEAYFNAGQVLLELGKPRDAAGSFGQAIRLAPADGEILKKATLCLLEAGHGEEALRVCQDLLQAQPDNLTARLGAEWILSQLVPLWHVPMVNEPERNQAFHDGLATLVGPDQVVFEIGTGSGLVAMMAARLGARKVVTCEAIGLVAATARKIIARNGFEDRVTVLAKPSQAVQLGPELPAPADILVHEIFSSELLGEGVLPAIEDAKARLLKPGGAVLPGSASIMVALVTGDALGKNLCAGQSFGFDLRDFNAIQPKKRPLYREDLAPVLLSEGIEAFRFDFAGQSSFPPEKKEQAITACRSGLCYGVIQWIRIDMVEGVSFENHPSRPRPVSNWQHTIYRFDEPVHVDEGTVVRITAMHDRSRPWFQLAR